jgi:hypothetical protein
MSIVIVFCLVVAAVLYQCPQTPVSVSTSLAVNFETVAFPQAQTQVAEPHQGHFASEFKKKLSCELITLGAQQLEYIYSIKHVNLLFWLNILCLGLNDVSVE